MSDMSSLRNFPYMYSFPVKFMATLYSCNHAITSTPVIAVNGNGNPMARK